MKRGPTREYKWQRRWCVLDAETLAYYTDELLKVCKGEILLKQASCARRFTDTTAPFDAPSYGRERPFGFLLDVEPSAGKRRRAFYFDALEGSALEAWEAAIAKSATEAQQKKARSLEQADQLCLLVRKRCYKAAAKPQQNGSSPPGRQDAIRISGFLRKSIYSCAGAPSKEPEKPAVVQRHVSTLLRKSLYSSAGLRDIKVSSLKADTIAEGDEEEDE